MPTVVTRPQTYELTEAPTLQQSDWREGMVQSAYRNKVTLRRWRLVWPTGTVGQLETYRCIFQDIAGPMGALFDWTPPREAVAVRARRVSPIRATVATPLSVRFEVEIESRHVPDIV